MLRHLDKRTLLVFAAGSIIGLAATACGRDTEVEEAPREASAGDEQAASSEEPSRRDEDGRDPRDVVPPLPIAPP